MKCSCHDKPMKKCPRCGTWTCMEPTRLGWGPALCPECNNDVAWSDAGTINLAEIELA